MKINQDLLKFFVFFCGERTGTITFDEHMLGVKYESVDKFGGDVKDPLFSHSGLKFLKNDSSDSRIDDSIDDSGVPHIIEGLMREAKNDKKSIVSFHESLTGLGGRRQIYSSGPIEIYSSNILIISEWSWSENWKNKSVASHKTNRVSPLGVNGDSSKTVEFGKTETKDYSSLISTINVVSRSEQDVFKKEILKNNPDFNTSEVGSSNIPYHLFSAIASGMQKKEIIKFLDENGNKTKNIFAIAKGDRSDGNTELGDCGLPAIEWLVNTFANSCNINIPDFFIATDNIIDSGELFYVSVMFGLPEKNSKTRPLVYDAGGAIGIHTKDKGDQKLPDLISLMMSEISAGRMGDSQIDVLIRQILFSYHVFNNDLHMKNMSIIFQLDDKNEKTVGTVLAPAYDMHGCLGQTNLETVDEFMMSNQVSGYRSLPSLSIPCLVGTYERTPTKHTLISEIVNNFHLGADIYNSGVEKSKRIDNPVTMERVSGLYDKISSDIKDVINSFSIQDSFIPELLRKDEVSMDAISRVMGWLRLGPEAYVAEIGAKNRRSKAKTPDFRSILYDLSVTVDAPPAGAARAKKMK